MRPGALFLLPAILGLSPPMLHGRAPEAFDWRAELRLPAPAEDGLNAWVRWRGWIDDEDDFDADDMLRLDAWAGDEAGAIRPGDFSGLLKKFGTRLREFELQAGERLSLPRPLGPGEGIDGVANLRRYAILRDIELRSRWLRAERTAALASALGLIRLGLDAGDDACSISGFLAGQFVAAVGIDAVGWMVGHADPSTGEACRQFAGWKEMDARLYEGLANALKGEYNQVFLWVLNQMPGTNDPAVLLAMFSTLGMSGGSRSVDGSEPLGRIANVLLDHEATSGLLGRPLARFIQRLNIEGEIRPGTFGVGFDPLAAGWREDLGAFGDHAFQHEGGALSSGEVEVVRDSLHAVENPFGKLLVLMMTPPVDELAASTQRVVEKARSVRAAAR